MRSGDPLGGAERVDGQVAEVVFLPGGREVAVARDEVVDIHDARTLAFSRTLEGHSGVVLGIELAGPARGLLWTAGRDGTAVGFDLTGTRGVAADGGPGRGRRRRQRGGGPWPRSPRGTKRSSTPPASSISKRGATSSGSSNRSPTASARSGTPPSPLTAGSPWPECSSGPMTSPRRSPTGAASWRGTPRPASWRARSTFPGNLGGSRSPRTGKRLLVNGSGGWALYDLASGEEIWTHRTELSGLLHLRPSPVGSRSRRFPPGRPQGRLRWSSSTPRRGTSWDPWSSPRSGWFLPGSLSVRTAARWCWDRTPDGLTSSTRRRWSGWRPTGWSRAGFVIDVQVSPDGSVLATMGSRRRRDPVRHHHVAALRQAGGRWAGLGFPVVHRRQPADLRRDRTRLRAVDGPRRMGRCRRAGPPTRCSRPRSRRLSCPANRSSRPAGDASASPRPGRDRSATDCADSGATTADCTSSALERESRP